MGISYMAANSGCVAWYAFEETGIMTGSVFANSVPGASGMTSNNIGTSSTAKLGRSLISAGGANSSDTSFPYTRLPEEFIKGASATGSGFTIAGWFYSFSTAAYARVFDFFQDTSNYIAYAPFGASSRSWFEVKIGGSAATIFPASPTNSINTWYHFACVLDGTNMNLYINGVRIGQTAKTTLPSTFSSLDTLQFFRSAYTVDPTFNGCLDELGIWKVALSSGEIAGTLYNSGSGCGYSSVTGTSLSGGLLGWFAFDEGFASRVNSVTGNPDFVDTNTKVRSSSTTSKIGSSAYFLGGGLSPSTSQELSMTTNLISGSAALSWSCWFNSTARKDFGRIFDVSQNSTYFFYLTPTNSSNVIQFEARTTAVTTYLTNSTTTSLNTWYHVVVTWISGRMRMYVNGTLVSSSTTSIVAPSAAFTWPQRMISGRSAAYPADVGYEGYIDEFSVWNRELSSDEVTTLYNAGAAITYSSLSGTITLIDPTDLAGPLKVTNYPTAAATVMSMSNPVTTSRVNPLYMTGGRIGPQPAVPIFLSGRIGGNSDPSTRRRLWVINTIRK